MIFVGFSLFAPILRNVFPQRICMIVCKWLLAMQKYVSNSCPSINYPLFFNKFVGKSLVVVIQFSLSECQLFKDEFSSKFGADEGGFHILYGDASHLLFELFFFSVNVYFCLKNERVLGNILVQMELVITVSLPLNPPSSSHLTCLSHIFVEIASCNVTRCEKF